VHQTVFAAGALPQTPLGSLQSFPRSPSWIKGGKGKGREERRIAKERNGAEREGEGREEGEKMKERGRKERRGNKRRGEDREGRSPLIIFTI